MGYTYTPVKYRSISIYNALHMRVSGGYEIYYTESGLKRPDKISKSVLLGKLFDFSGYVPRLGEETSVLRIPIVIKQADSSATEPNTFNHTGETLDKLEQMSFIVLEADDLHAGSPPSIDPRYYYGWVDGYRIIGSGGPEGQVEITYHLDYYLTYAAQTRNDGSCAITYGNGHILRGPKNMSRPDPSAPRFWVYDTDIDIADTYKWCIVQRAVNDANDKRTKILTDFWPIGGTITIGGNAVDCPDYADIYGGLIEERLEIAPETVIGAWISPIQPITISSYAQTKTDTNVTYAWYELDLTQTINNAFREYTGTLSNDGALMTDDEGKWMLVDPHGAVMGTMPWGMRFDTVYACVDIGTTSANLVLHFCEASDANSPQFCEGRDFTIPLESVPVTDNATSSYIYSGQREYDMETKRLQQEQNLVSGVLGAGQGAIGGAVAGGLSSAGGGVGAVAGAVVSVGAAVGNYFVQGHYDRKNQEAVDRLMANQTGNVIIGAGGLAWKYARDAPHEWSLVHMVRDTDSLQELQDQQSNLGYVTDIYYEGAGNLGGTVDDIIKKTGWDPLTDPDYGVRIEGLQVRGVGTAAQRQIAELFARGVHIDIVTL